MVQPWPVNLSIKSEYHRENSILEIHPAKGQLRYADCIRIFGSSESNCRSRQASASGMINKGQVIWKNFVRIYGGVG